MKPLLNRCIVASLHRSCDSAIQNSSGWPVLLFAALFFPTIAGAQMPLPEPAVTRSSVSGQFVVISPNPFPSSARPPAAVTDAEFVQLDPALLAVSAERVKKPLWRELGIDLTTPWRGRIFLALHPAESSDENITIISTRFADAWSYRVELPDISSRTSLTRALTGAVLLELANRDNSGDRSAEIPAWLTEGLTQQLLASGATEMILSPPDKTVNGLPENRTVAVEHGVDAFAKVRPALRDHLALTFEQLSWPDDAQLRGNDGGVYHASAQLFVNELLNLNHGAEHLRAVLQMLPRYYNWQTAFRAAFAADFPQPIDLEKWWALQTVIFAAGDAGTAWTPAVSSGKLAEILSVPVEFRSASNSLPAHAAISLQAVIRNFDSARQTAILQTKLRDLGLAQWRMAPQFAVLTDAYRRALADYLGGNNNAAPAVRAIVKRPQAATLNESGADTVRKLDALDAQRRTMENSIKPNIAAKKSRRDFAELPPEIIDKLQIDFYSDPSQAAFKALLDA